MNKSAYDKQVEQFIEAWETEKAKHKDVAWKTITIKPNELSKRITQAVKAYITKVNKAYKRTKQRTSKLQ